ncbi:hypothetical protein AB1285_21910 [Microbacterium sp. NRRL B-14842]|jgi:hypothetical protein|uniref:hypothetical protein n=2 Tax=Microbacteriaceae TaxID=85023 RepID=UPI002041830E|nr:hypothetical protein [Microbacterium sp. USTB-Y]MBS0475919.1 hypothetical protein [Pseudomonadota bacterium]
MSTLNNIVITDDTGTRYNDLFTDIPLDSYEITRSSVGFHSVDAIVPADPYSPRASEEGPLGALLLRWAQAHVAGRNYIISWQYIDAHDVHTVAVADTATRELHFVNLFGHVIAGRRSYRLRELADALDLLIDATFD